MLRKLNSSLERWIPIITPFSVLIGVLLGAKLTSYTFLIPWIFSVISFSSSLGLNVQDLRRTIKKPLPILVCLLILQIIMPIIAFGLGKLIFYNDYYTVTGIILAFTIPTGVVSLMWVNIYNGNRALTLSIILINTLLSPFTVPLILNILVGARVSIDTFGMMSGIFWMVVFPSLLAITINQIKPKQGVKLKVTLAPFSKIALFTVIILNSSVVSPYFKEINNKFLLIAVVIFSLAITGYIIGFFSGKILKWSSGTQLSLMYNSGMRNIGVGAALAITYFPPPVALPVVMTIIFQQVIASISGRVVSKYIQKEDKSMKIVT